MMTITFGYDFDLHFHIDQNHISELWLEKMSGRHAWSLDDPKRFYGFDDIGIERTRAEQRLRECIDVINDYQPIIDRPWSGIDDQDYLNYLHHIFEEYHGLLDQQDTEWWQACPPGVRRALADLNIAVHRAESASRTNRPRLVCTWFGMPKDSFLDEHDMIMHGRLCYEFGGVYLNYVEIGKTVEDLTIDDDRWIGDEAFQPFMRYSADFNIRFYDNVADIPDMYRYFSEHKDFFKSKGIDHFDDHRVLPRRYKVAQLYTDLDRSLILSELAARQHITSIKIT